MPKDKCEKINKAFTEQVMPLFNVWVNACSLTDLEADILFYKMFDENHYNEQKIMEILEDKYGYYYSDRAFRKLWRKIKRKIEGLLP